MSARIAILCSGQGGQGREMFGWLADAPDAEPVFAAAASGLDGTDPRRFVREADEAALFGNRAGQVLCVTQALAAWAVLSPVIAGVSSGSVVLAGYSVGELAAWGCAGLLSPQRTLELAVERSRLMDQAAPAAAGLAAIVGIAGDAQRALLERHGLHLAIRNDDASIVVGGLDDALDACVDEARRLGATRALRLRVAVPSHTPLLHDAAEAFAGVLAAESPARPRGSVRLLSGIDGEIVRDPEDGLRKLAAQIEQTVRWDVCLRSCEELGARTMLELGPGSALAGMAQAFNGSAMARSISQFRSADGVRAWLKTGRRA